MYKSKSHTLSQDLKKQLDVLPVDMIQKYNHIVTKSISGKREISDFGFVNFANSDYTSIVISSDGVHNELDTVLFLNNDLKIINERLLLTAKDNNSYILINNFKPDL